MSLKTIYDYQKKASEKLRNEVFEYFRGIEPFPDFNRFRIIKADECKATTPQLRTKLFGTRDLSMPIAIGPIPFQTMIHKFGEIATARAAGAAGIPFTLSAFGTTSIEELAESTRGVVKWFGLYSNMKHEIRESLVRRAENAWFDALVFSPMESNPIRENMRIGSSSNSNEYIWEQIVSKPYAWDWNDLKWLKSSTNLPVIVKGILTVDQAEKAVENGADGIIVSNVQLDASVTTPVSTVPMAVLPDIVKAVGHKCVVMIQGGFQQGRDIFKALALGAQVVLVDQPAVWGLAVNGQKGVEHVLQILRDELEVAATMCGYQSIDDVRKDVILVDKVNCKI